jgi:hypothetical protein
MAHHYASAHDGQVRFAIPHRSTLRVLKLTGFDQLLSIYPSLRAAVPAGPALAGHVRVTSAGSQPAHGVIQGDCLHGGFLLRASAARLRAPGGW